MNVLRFLLDALRLMLVEAAMEVAQLGRHGDGVRGLRRFEGEESEVREERETQSEKEGKLKLKALLAARH